jgi:hypothetical protein
MVITKAGVDVLVFGGILGALGMLGMLGLLGRKDTTARA